MTRRPACSKRVLATMALILVSGPLLFPEMLRSAVAEGIPPAPPSAAEAPVLNQHLSLDDAVGLALRYSPTLQQAQDDLDAAAAQVIGARAGGKPSLSVTLFGSRSSWSNILNTPDTTPPVNLMGIPPGNFLDQNITAMLPLYTGGRVSAAARRARALQTAATADLEAMRQDVALQTRIAYRKVLYQNALVDAQQQNSAAAQEALRLDTDRYQAGKLAEVVLFRDRTAAANAQQEVTNARRDRQQALFALETVMGVDVRSQLTLTDTLPTPLPNPSGMGATAAVVSATSLPVATGPPVPETAGADLPVLLASALAHRPEIRAAAERTRAAAAELNRARSASNPQINLMGMGDLTHGSGGTPNGLNYTIGIAAGLPLFEGGAIAAGEREAAAGLRKARAAEQAVQLQVNNDVASAWANEQAARQNLDTSQIALAQAQEDYSIQQVRFAAGKGLQLEVLDALAALTTARTQVARAAFEYAVAQNQLLRATGTILPTPGP